MSSAVVELPIPPEIYARAQQIAKDSNRSIEAVLVDGLALLFGGLSEADITPEQLQTYTDDQLWTVVHHRLSLSQDTRLRELVALGKSGNLSDDEKSEMESLIDLVDRTMLLRSHALLLLKQRGHDIESSLKLGG